MRVLVLESSTTSAKAMLYDSKVGVVRVCAQTYDPRYNHDGMQDAAYVMKETFRMGREAAQGEVVDYITVGGVWHSVVCCDKDGSALTPVYSWSYTGAAAYTRQLRQDRAYTLDYYRRSGCVPHVTYTPFKLRYLQQAEGLDLKDKQCWEQSAYNYFHLTGVAVTTASTASGGGLIRLGTTDYDPQTLEEIGITQDQLPLLRTYRESAPLSKAGAELLGLKEGIPVMPPLPDGALNQVGAAALEPGGPMTLSVGTSGALRLSIGKPLLSDPPGTWCYLAPTPWWITGAATAGACNCLDWALERYFPAGTGHPEAQQAPVPEHLPVFLPFLYGERCPGWRDDRPAALPDLTGAHTGQDIYYGMMQGVLFNLYQCYRILCGLNGGEPETIQLSGGILRSPLWTQMCCDVFGRDMSCPDMEQASMMGAAALALEAGGELASNQDLPQSAARTVAFRPEAHQRYLRAFEEYLDWYQRLTPPET